MTRRRGVTLVAPAALGCVVYLVVPQASVPQVLLYQSVAWWCFVVAVLGVVRTRPARIRVWWALLSGMGSWVIGEACWAWAKWVAHTQPYPSVADAFFLTGYCLLGLGLYWLVRGRQAGRDVAALIDALVVAIGVGVVLGVFVIAPVAMDSSQSLVGRVVGSAYPLADVLLLGLLARLLSTPGSTATAFRLLVASVTASLVADAGYDAVTLTGSGSSTPRWLDATWLACYVLFAAAAVHPSLGELAEPAPRREETVTRRRLTALAVASALAPATLLLQVGLGHRPSAVIAGIGSLSLSALVFARMTGLLDQVRRQAVQLVALASLDALTGAPNRRTWDLELSKACAHAQSSGEPLAVAMLDLDHFKAFNDSHGHQAGDRLLKEATSQWVSALRDDDFLARYGGEEFALLLPGAEPAVAVAVLERLRGLTPSGQTFSAGVTMWLVGEDLAAALGRADQALYQAKRSGRDRVHVAEPSAATTPTRTTVDHLPTRA